MRTPRHHVAVGLVAIGAVVAAACADATAPTVASLAGTYTLRSIAGQALPVGLVLADTLELRPDGTVRRTRVDNMTSLADPTRSVAYPFVVAGTWTQHGDSVVIHVPSLDPPGSSGGLGARGHGAAGQLTFVGPGDLWPAVAGATAIVYHR